MRLRIDGTKSTLGFVVFNIGVLLDSGIAQLIVQKSIAMRRNLFEVKIKKDVIVYNLFVNVKLLFWFRTQLHPLHPKFENKRCLIAIEFTRNSGDNDP